MTIIDVWRCIIIFVAVCGIALLIVWLNKPKNKTVLWVLTFLWIAAVGAIAFFFISLMLFLSHI